MMSRANRWLEALLALVYPSVCQICGAGRAVAREGYVCDACRCRPDGVRFILPPFCERCGLPVEGAVTTAYECGNCRDMQLDFSQARAVVVATGLVMEVIHRYKYNRALWFEPFLAELLCRKAAPEIAGTFDAIVPVPLHPLKAREREFNQAERLATTLGRASGLPVLRRAVRRVRFTATQTAFNRGERQRNMRGAFAVATGEPLVGRRLVVVDDVLTTGATTSACARALRKAGATEVAVWTVARGL
ncbi:MAG: ComF family protein [Verrucomicrobiae bacterium]|nr:ComF family protein [Verrucomicrobiae bacterium]MCP5520937.1 ComF family protein [Verrucomicrobiales bacterium]